jgi:O-antigen/teichoic acid export membrane protein
VLVVVPLATYYLEPKDFGVAAILNGVAMPIGPLSSTGFTWVLSTHFYKVTDAEQKVLVFNVLLGETLLRALWIAAFALCAPLMLPRIVSGYEPAYLDYFYLVLAATLVSGLWPSISYTVVLKQLSRQHAVMELASWLAGVLATIVGLTLLKLSTITLFISPLVAGVVSAGIGIGYAWRETTARVSRRWLREILRIGVPSIPANLLELLGSISSRYFIQRWMGLGPLGIYAHSESYRTILTMGAKAFSRTFSPEMLQAVVRGAEPTHARDMLRWWYSLLALGGLAMGFFIDEFIDLLTHGKFAAAAPLTIVWFCLVISYSFGLPYASFLSVHEKNEFMVNTGTLINGLFIGLVAVAAFAVGPIGAAVAVTFSNVTMQVVRRVYARSLGCERIGETGALAALLSTVGAYTLNAVVSPPLLPKLGAVMVAAIAVATWARMVRLPKPVAG